MAGIEIDLLKVGEASKSGDAILVRWGELSGSRDQQFVMVIDGGFTTDGEKVVNFVKARYGTDWIDLLVSTHPDRDHTGGLMKVVKDLNPCEIWMHLPWEHSSDIRDMFHDGRITDTSLDRRIKDAYDHVHEIYELALEQEIAVTEPFVGATGVLQSEAIGLYVLGPTKDYYQSLLPHFRGTPQGKKEAAQHQLGLMFARLATSIKAIWESWSTETLKEPSANATAAENESSVVLLLIYEEKAFLFGGDAGVTALANAIAEASARNYHFGNLTFFKVPHHGSRHNIGPSALDGILGHIKGEGAPGTIDCVVTAADGDPDHPSKKVMNALTRRGGSVSTTEKGNILVHRGTTPQRSDYYAVDPKPIFGTIEDED